MKPVTLLRFLSTLLIASVSAAVLAGAQVPPTSPFKTRPIDPILEEGSPDGRWVIYRSEDAPRRVMLREVATGKERELVTFPRSIGDIQWSRDGKHIAFEVARVGERELDVHIVAAASGTTERVFESGGLQGWTDDNRLLLAWSPDFRLATLDGAARVVFTSKVQNVVSITPDGRRLVIREPNRYVLRDLETGLEREWLRVDRLNGRLRFSPDGRLAAFAGNGGLYVARVDAQGEPALRLSDLEQTLRSSMWWTTGNALVVANVLKNTENLYRVDVDSRTGRARGPFRLLLTNADAPAVSPDSRWIAHTCFRNCAIGSVAGIVSASGGANKPLGPARATKVYDWRSSTVIVVEGAPGVSTIDVTTMAEAPQFPWTFKRWEAYVPVLDEVWLVVRKEGDTAMEIRARSLKTGLERAVTTIERLGTYRVSPDGLSIAYSRQSDPAGKSDELRLRRLDRPGEDRRLVQKTSLDPGAWSPDGRLLLYFDWTGKFQAHVFDVNALTSVTFSESVDQPDWRWQDASWSPDGSFLALGGHASWKDPIGKVFEGVSYDAVVRATGRANPLVSRGK